MRALKIAYPVPKTVSEFAQLRGLRGLEKRVDFPERRLSYVIYDLQEQDWERCALEVRKAVFLHAPGTEPSRLEIRLPQLN